MTQLRTREPKPQGGLSNAPRKRQNLTPDEWQDRCNEARALSYCGATVEEIASFFEVSVPTLYQWGTRWPPFLDAMRELSHYADDRVEKSLYKQALEGNTTAAIFWLKNRRANEWRDKRDIDLGGEIKMDSTDPRQLALALIATMREAAEDGMRHPLIEGELSDDDHGRGEQPEPEAVRSGPDDDFELDDLFA